MANLTNHSPFQDEHWMTTTEAMAHFLVSSRTLQRWCKQKQILACYIGGTKYYPKKLIENMMFLKAMGQYNSSTDGAAQANESPSQP